MIFLKSLGGKVLIKTQTNRDLQGKKEGSSILRQCTIAKSGKVDI